MCFANPPPCPCLFSGRLRVTCFWHFNGPTHLDCARAMSAMSKKRVYRPLLLALLILEISLNFRSFCAR